MGALSDTDAANLLNSKFGAATLDVPAHYFFGLSTTEPNDDGSNVTEPAGSYARVSVTPNTTNFPATSTRSITTGTDITWPTPGSGDDWGVCGWYALYDAATGGNFRGWGRFAEALHIKDGDSAPVAPAGSIVIVAPGS